MFKFIHLTDPHVIGKGMTFYGSDPARRLEAAVASINDEHADAAFAVVTGDLTHWGEEQEYRAFAEQISKLSIPYHLMAGNHDVTAEMRRHFPDLFDDGNGFVQGICGTPVGTCLFLDTHQDDKHPGYYCEKRRAWLAEQLAADDEPVFLFMHHPPFKVGIAGMDPSRMLDSETLWAVLEPHRSRIRHLFFGHIHRPISGSWRGIPISCMRATNQQLALDLSQDATENPDIMRVPGNLEEPAYGVILADEDIVIVHMHEFLKRSPHFMLIPPPDRPGRDYALMMNHDGWKAI